MRLRDHRRLVAASAGVLGLGLCLGLGMAYAADAGPAPGPSLTAAQVEAFESELLPIVTAWGRVEVQGMRPGANDLQDPDPAAAQTVAAEAAAWQGSLQGLNAQLSALTTPQALATTTQSFQRSLERYLDAAELFALAAEREPPERQDLAGQGIEAARDGARLYNEASMQLQSARHAGGLPTSPDFPDHPAEQAPPPAAS